VALALEQQLPKARTLMWPRLYIVYLGVAEFPQMKESARALI
jgi:hypothetical protein